MRDVPYTHPGEILMEEFLKPMGIKQYRLAKAISVPQRRMGEIVAGARSITADTGLRLSRFFGTFEGFWTGLRLDYDATRAKDAFAETLAQIKPWQPATISGSVVLPKPAWPRVRHRGIGDHQATENLYSAALHTG